MPFSIRFDRETEQRIRRLSAETGRSRAAVVREAVAEYSAARESGAPGTSALDRLKPFIGIVASGGADYSVGIHEKYRALLRRRHRAGRTR